MLEAVEMLGGVHSIDKPAGVEARTSLSGDQWLSAPRRGWAEQQQPIVARGGELQWQHTSLNKDTEVIDCRVFSAAPSSDMTRSTGRTALAIRHRDLHKTPGAAGQLWYLPFRARLQLRFLRARIVEQHPGAQKSPAASEVLQTRGNWTLLQTLLGARPQSSRRDQHQHLAAKRNKRRCNRLVPFLRDTDPASVLILGGRTATSRPMAGVVRASEHRAMFRAFASPSPGIRDIGVKLSPSSLSTQHKAWAGAYPLLAAKRQRSAGQEIRP
ncbi:uncharacterized protein B0I36DRAFT_350408 [Microdochium trichocladiopsis]|uniref:Uncharacterized protein n=1 Tax=Microdochium trichocladiopsis TaxID=1682393 RepID=A0A9P8Y555_9PEZI|nr:uncharacterized protein B0I36DRAFT_350408 [Microdochium trichocladiopsis]KAH7029554.1 hypothetical protein B0I36DRAFT_350408 [Microdochium trichocladiopsis]